MSNAQPKGSRAKRRILLIDPDPQSGDEAKSALLDLEIDICVETSFARAQVLLMREGIEVVVVDDRFSNPSSLDLIAILKQLRPVAIVAYGNGAEPGTQLEYRKAGAFAFVSKQDGYAVLAEYLRLALPYASEDDVHSQAIPGLSDIHQRDIIQTVEFDGFIFDFKKKRLIAPGGACIRLPGKPGKLFEFLAGRVGETVPYAEIFEHLGDADKGYTENHIASIVRKIRAIIKKHDSKAYPIVSERGIGYRLSAQVLRD
jgi:DNA-binding response OmpR family regulator